MATPNSPEHDALPIETDVAIIGAGPVGLFAAFELGLLELSTQLIDALPRVGGQPAELYADKPIYDIPGTPVCTGQQLTDGLLQQIAPFKAPLHLGHRVDSLLRQHDGRLLLTTHKGLRLLAKAVFVAAGVGAFEPRRLKLEGLDSLEDCHVFHHRPANEALTHQRVVILGSEDSALERAIELATMPQPRPRSVALLHRRDRLQAAPATTERFHALCAEGKIDFVVGQIQAFDAPDGQLTALHILGQDGQTQPLAADKLLVMQGFSPRLGPIASWELAMEHKQLVVDTEKFQTSEPGIFAVGDINTYPGKKKLLLSGFHEATLAAYAAQALISPEREIPLQYTTSSSRIHRLLGVEPE